MLINAVVEIIPGESKRLVFVEDLNEFVIEDFDHIFMNDSFGKYFYGWIDGYGTPPNNHWDVIVITRSEVNYGELIEGKLIGVFFRCDGDHKFIAIDADRSESNITQLKDEEISMVLSKYSGKFSGDSWLGYEDAASLLVDGRYLSRDSGFNISDDSVFELDWKKH